MSGELEPKPSQVVLPSATFLPKPFPLEQLLTAVAGQLKRTPDKRPHATKRQH
jgi:hypothetical protein